MKASELVGHRATIKVHKTPCRVVYGDCEVLTETVTGRLTKFINMPAGPIGFIEVGKVLFAFDAGADIEAGKIEIELQNHLRLVQ